MYKFEGKYVHMYAYVYDTNRCPLCKSGVVQVWINDILHTYSVCVSVHACALKCGPTPSTYTAYASLLF